ncbi:MAG: translation initiation factor IF-2 [Lachnospiraceae bacterium]|nr:translation initiation factor IF-2 [Lachnospiraceae bacterium]
MAKKRIHEIAKDLGVESKDVLAVCAQKGFNATTSSSGLDEDQIAEIKKYFSKASDKAESEKKADNKSEKKPEKTENAPKAENKAEEKKPQAEEKAPAKQPQTEEKAPTKQPQPQGKQPQQASQEQPKKKRISIVLNDKARPGNGGGRPQNQQGGGRPGGQGGYNQSRPQQPVGRIKPLTPPSPTPSVAMVPENKGFQPKKPHESAPAVKEAAPAANTAQAPVKENTAPVKENVQKGFVNGGGAQAAGRGADRQGAGTRPTSDRFANNRGGAVNGKVKNDGQKPLRPQGEGFKGNNRNGNSNPGPGRGFNNSGRDGRPNERQGAGFGENRNQKGFQNQAAPAEGGDKSRGGRRDKGKDRDRRKDIAYEEENEVKRAGRFIKPEKKVEVVEEVIKVITLPDTITIKDLAEKMKQRPADIVKKLFLAGKMVTLNDELSFEDAETIAMEYEILCEHEVKVDIIEELLKEDEEDPSLLKDRPPVVCVMGHVDHGKTSLLDAIRKTKVTDKEAGGITQAIGAYTVDVQGRTITFLDTPGHEAFTAMRMRGANSTDIAILVVAADDGVMPQTVEAINHAKAAGVEIIVAVNKIDKPSANIDRVKQELSEYELISEDWGGSTVFAPVSAKTGEGIDNLLDMILLTADVLELKANPDRTARGLVIEAELDKGRGPVATVLVQKGTLHVGDFISAGAAYGKVRAMIDDKGRRVKEATPSTPVEILGLSDVPEAGEVFLAHENDKTARQFAETYKAENKAKKLEEIKGRMSLEDLFSKIKEGNLKELNIIVKADVQGSVEAVKESLTKLSNDEVVVKCIHGGVGAINESDVSLASASNAIIIGFNVRPDATAKATAEEENVDLRLYDVIYKAIEDIELAMKGMLDPVFEEKVIGHAEIRQIFKASAIGNISGSYVLDGEIQRGCKVRITREGEQIFEGDLASLKRFKDDVKEVKAGFECGLVFDGFDKVQELDQVEAYIMVEVPR